jgi:hypothetical protein
MLAVAMLLGACEGGPLVDRREVDPSGLLPRHGVLYHGYWMRGDYRVVVDFDTRELVLDEHSEGAPDHSVKRTLTAEQVEWLRPLAQAAVYEAPGGEEPRITDVGAVLVVLAGNLGFQASGTAFGMEGWRVRGGELVKAIAALAQ